VNVRARIATEIRSYALICIFLFALQKSDWSQAVNAASEQNGAIPVASGPATALSVVTESLRHAADDLQLRKNYTYQEREVEKHLDGSGNITKTIVHTYDIVVIGQTRLARLIAKDDQPLGEMEASKEEDRIRKEQKKAEERMRKANSREEADKEEDNERRTIKYFPEMYSFAFAGEDVVDGEPVWIITATPIASYRPHAMEARVLKCLRWKLWITKNGYHWVRREGEAINDFNLGLFLVKLHKGMRVQMEQTKVNNEVWLPRLARASDIDARIVWHTQRVELETTYSDYKKFRADSKVTGIAAPPPQ